jgi:hypothetical protein
MKNYRILSVVILAIMLVNVTAISAGCRMFGEQGNGNVIKQERTVPAFNAIRISGAFDLILSQGPTQSVTVKADENLMPIIRTEVKGDELIIENTKPIHNSHEMKVYVIVKELKKIDISGAVDMETAGKLTLDELTIDGSGASDSKMELDVRKLDIDCSGGSKLKFSGTATNVKMDVSGAVDIYAYDLLTETFHLNISGAGNAQINVSKELSAEISGAGSVRYKGKPEKISEDVSGAGSIKKVD